MADRRYTDDDVSRILQRAVELQQQQPALAGSSDGLSLAQLEEVARESGIDPALVRRAAAELEQQPAAEPPSRFLGAPGRIVVRQVVTGHVGTATREQALAEIQRVLGQVGQVTASGGGFHWTTLHNTANANLRELSVAITPRGDATRIVIEEKATGLAFGIFGGLLGGIGGASLGVAIPAGLISGSWALGLGLPAVALGLAYALARSVYGSSVRRRTRELMTLAATLAELAEPTGTLRPDRP